MIVLLLPIIDPVLIPAPKSIPVVAVAPVLVKVTVLSLIVEVYVTPTGAVPPPCIITP